LFIYKILIAKIKWSSIKCLENGKNKTRNIKYTYNHIISWHSCWTAQIQMHCFFFKLNINVWCFIFGAFCTIFQLCLFCFLHIITQLYSVARWSWLYKVGWIILSGRSGRMVTRSWLLIEGITTYLKKVSMKFCNLWCREEWETWLEFGWLHQWSDLHGKSQVVIHIKSESLKLR
jgi:hypothetical protein